jgi:hypothetical protein
VLDPLDRLSEVLFGLIMALTFTGSISAAEAGHGEVRTLLWAALGCNLAWGIVDAVMYLMACVGERGAAWRIAREFQAARDPAQARALIAQALPPGIAAAVGEEGLEPIRQALAARLEVPPRPRLRWEDARGALAVFLLVFLSTFPVVVPFLLTDEPLRALRLSNAVAMVMLFGLGLTFGRLAGWRPWVMGLAMVALGAALVGIAMALGG